MKKIARILAIAAPVLLLAGTAAPADATVRRTCTNTTTSKVVGGAVTVFRHELTCPGIHYLKIWVVSQAGKVRVLVDTFPVPQTPTRRI